jgi:hypothetical protein
MGKRNIIMDVNIKIEEPRPLQHLAAKNILKKMN